MAAHELFGDVADRRPSRSRFRRVLTAASIVLHAIVISIEVGAAKPAPAIFARAAALLKAEPNRILHVGDSPHEDVVGAQEAGWSALKISRATANDWGLANLAALPAALGIALSGPSSD